jgi:hypothetical protein
LYRSGNRGVIGYRLLSVSRADRTRFAAVESVRKITFARKYFAYLARFTTAPTGRSDDLRDAAMNASLVRFLARFLLFRRRIALALGLCLALFSAGSVQAEPGTPAQRKACTPDVYRLCAGEIPNVRAITACLRRQKENLSEACKAVFEQ